VSTPAPVAVTRPAHAKINVFLRVLGARDDGFHEVETVALPISLHDVVTATEAPPGVFTLDVDGDRDVAGALETGFDENLAGLAVRALVRTTRRRSGDAGIALHIDKRIPVAAGLGGGSADAAAALLATAEVWRCGLSRETALELAAELGSDVPAMMAGEPVLAAGRGERLTPVHAASTWWVLKPFGFGVRAADAYGWWDDRPVTGPDPGVLVAALETGDVELLGDALFNDLQPSVTEYHPEIAEAQRSFLGAGALGVVMSGSGPTVAALARHIGHAESLARAVPGSLVVGSPPRVAPEVGAG
jgi:4-diphosphocytidyl-2-C-methyl-D-erythritol kinase